MALLLVNNATGKLALSITPSDTTIVLLPGNGAAFPVIASGDWFPMTLSRADGRLEIVRVTARSGDTFTVERGQEGTQTLSFSISDRAELRLTVGALDARIAPAETSTGTSFTPAPHVTSTNAQDAIVEVAAAVVASDISQTNALATHKASTDHDGRYYLKAEVDAGLAAKQPTGDYATNATVNAHRSSADHDGRYYARPDVDYLLSLRQPAGSYAVPGTPTNFGSGSVPNFAGAAGQAAAIEVHNAGNGAAAAAIAFHRHGTYATYFGLDTDNQFAWGGWSAGGARYRFWTEANFNPATKANAGAQCQFDTGTSEFAHVDISLAGATTSDAPAGYVMTGLRTAANNVNLNMRGRKLRNQ